MINDKTSARLAELGGIVASASYELDCLFRELSAEADRQLKEAAEAFAVQYAKNHRTEWHEYRNAHDALLKASIAASNIHELGQRAVSLSNKCGWWAMLNQLSGSVRMDQHGKDITHVIEKALDAVRAAGAATGE